MSQWSRLRHACGNRRRIISTSRTRCCSRSRAASSSRSNSSCTTARRLRSRLIWEYWDGETWRGFRSTSSECARAEGRGSRQHQWTHAERPLHSAGRLRDRGEDRRQRGRGLLAAGPPDATAAAGSQHIAARCRHHPNLEHRRSRPAWTDWGSRAEIGSRPHTRAADGERRAPAGSGADWHRHERGRSTRRGRDRAPDRSRGSDAACLQLSADSKGREIPDPERQLRDQVPLRRDLRRDHLHRSRRVAEASRAAVGSRVGRRSHALDRRPGARQGICRLDRVGRQQGVLSAGSAAAARINLLLHQRRSVLQARRERSDLHGQDAVASGRGEHRRCHAAAPPGQLGVLERTAMVAAAGGVQLHRLSAGPESHRDRGLHGADRHGAAHDQQRAGTLGARSSAERFVRIQADDHLQDRRCGHRRQGQLLYVRRGTAAGTGLVRDRLHVAVRPVPRRARARLQRLQLHGSNRRGDLAGSHIRAVRARRRPHADALSRLRQEGARRPTGVLLRRRRGTRGRRRAGVDVGVLRRLHLAAHAGR